MDSSTLERDYSEIERSAEEARRSPFKAQSPADLERYIAPPPWTPYSLEYAFYLLGDVRGKVVLDFGCGSGECLVPLIQRSANVIGLDISPDLIEIAQKRLDAAGLSARLIVRSAYETELPSASVDVIFCMSLIHHLDIARVRQEMCRLLAPGGYIVLKEPIRFWKVYSSVRRFLPSRNDVSEYEHPLTREELSALTESFTVEELRHFRLPFVPLALRWLPGLQRPAWKLSAAFLRRLPGLEKYATSVAMRLRK